MTQREHFDAAISLVISKGFHFHDICNCGGALRHCYSGNGKFIEVLFHRPMFILKQGNKQGNVLFTGNYNEIETAINEN